MDSLILYQIDVKTAYLNAPIDCEIYIDQPEGYVDQSPTGRKQSGRNWKAVHAGTCLPENVFLQNPADYCVYTREKRDEKVILITWVDDLIRAASNHNVLKSAKAMMTKTFQMKDQGKMKHFLGFDESQGKVKMSPKRYVNQVFREIWNLGLQVQRNSV